MEETIPTYVICYLVDGQEVVIHKKLDEGFLIKRIYDYFKVDDEYRWTPVYNSTKSPLDLSEDQLGDIEYASQVFIEPPVGFINKEILDLEERKEALTKEISKLREAKINEESSFNKIMKIPSFQKIIDYFTGEFNWYLTHRYEIIESSRRNKKTNIAIQMIDGVVKMYSMDNNYFGASMTEVSIFKTREEAEAELKNRLVNRISSETSLYQIRDYLTGALGSLVDKFPEIKQFAKEKELKLIEKDKQDKIQKAKEELEKNKEILTNLGVI